MVNRNFDSGGVVHSCIIPQTVAAAGDVEGTGVNVQGFTHALVIFHIGTQGTAAVATCTVEAADAVDGTYATLTGGSFTVTEASGEDEQLYFVEILLDHMPAGKPFLTASVASATEDTPASVEILLSNSRDTSRYVTADQATLVL